MKEIKLDSAKVCVQVMAAEWMGETMRQKETSVTRFGEILPLWHNFKNLEDIFEGLISVWQNVDPTVAKMFYSWASFHCSRWPNTLK